MAALFSKNSCFHCKIAINSFKNGWQLRSGQLAKLCDLCAFFYEDGRFCYTFHSSEDGWRECESCQKLIHCGCGVSRYDYVLSDSCGIVCIDCTKQNLMNIVRQETGIPSVGDNENSVPAHGNYGNSNDESAGTGKDLQQISKKAQSVVTPLFEKLLSDNDADPKLARVVIPRKCAEKFFPLITEPNGIPLQVQDSNGKDWVFTFRHWPNANSKMSIIDGLEDFMGSLHWRAGDKMKFSRIEPDGKFIIEVIKAIVCNSVTFGGMSRLQDSMAHKRKRGEQSSLLTQYLGEADRNVLDIIKGKKDLAIAIAEIRRLSKLPANQVNKSIKTLTTNQLIKEVPNIKYNVKHYMAAEFEPSKELTGGQWYADGRLNQELIEFLKSTCLKIVGKLKVATAKGVHEFFIKYKVITEEVSYQQIVEILRSMVLDNEILEVKSTGLKEYHSIPVGEVCYRCVTGGGVGEASKTCAMASMPCGVCPRINLCTPDGVISPTTCVYYTKWLDF